MRGRANAFELRGIRDPDVRVKIERDNTFGDVIGVVSIRGDERVWILAKASRGEGLKILPGDASVRISRAEFEMITRQTKMSDEVRLYLLNAIHPSL